MTIGVSAALRARLVAACLATATILPAQQDRLILTDVSASTGVDWTQIDNNTMMGAGAAFLDFDGDGWLDVLLAGGCCATPGLFRSTRRGSRFERVQPDPFETPTGPEYLCVTVADVDNDGDPDVFFGRFGPNLLYRNDGGGRFTDITTPALRGGIYTFTTAAAFGDYDADGQLDLYVANYVAPGSVGPRHTPTPNRLFRGLGDGRFDDTTTPVVAGAGTALATTWSDFDRDRDVDILLGNDFGAFVEPNQLYRNDGPSRDGWRFVERGGAAGFDLGIYCMGIAIGDCDRDGDFDYYVTNLGRNALLRNDGHGFVDITAQSGTELTYDVETSPRLFATSWGTGFHDFDLDGWLDLYVSNGYIPTDPGLANGRFTRNTLYRHDGPSLTFSRMTAPLDAGIGRGVAFGDYDNDGDVDILQASVSGPAALLRNDSPRSGHWFTAGLRGRLSNRDALGARVDLELDDFVACREVSRNYSFESSSDPRAHFGLGAANRVRRATVEWPSGVRQSLHDLGVDRAVTWREPLVTVDRGRLRRLTLPFGSLLWFDAIVTHHGNRAAAALVAPQLRVGYGQTSGLGLPGSTAWSGDSRPLALQPGQRRPIAQALWLPRGITLPDLNFVWTVADNGLGFDEVSIPLR